MPGFGAFFDYLKIILGLLHAAEINTGVYIFLKIIPLFFGKYLFSPEVKNVCAECKK